MLGPFKKIIPLRVRQAGGSALRRAEESLGLVPVFDAWAAALPSREMLPPQRLNASGPGDFQRTGDEFVALFRTHGRLRSNEHVLDVGCGIGRMAVPLTRYLDSGAQYRGIDIMPVQIRWCKRHITSRHGNFRFHHADIYNEMYNPRGGTAASEFNFPFEDGFFDFVFATSLFTHMRPAELQHYLREIVRVMKPSGRCFLTFFLLNDESVAAMQGPGSTINFDRPMDGFWTKSSVKMPEQAIAYSEADVRRHHAEAGLTIDEPIRFGNWCGRQQHVSYQDIVISRKL